ncbi:MAG: DUF1801 domain-containing protein [Actinomycetes bacterium]
MTSDGGLGLLLADHPDAVVRTALRLRAVLLDGRPELAERVRPGWHSINFHHPTAGFVCALFPLADRVDLVFERGALLPDPNSRLTGTGRQVRSLRFPARDDVDPEVVLEYLDLAVELGAASRSRGVRGSASTRTHRPPVSP